MSKNRPVQLMIILGALALSGLIAVQVYWVSMAVSAEEETFDHNVRMSLRAVADNMCQIDGNELINEKPIDRVASNYFVARLRYNIDISILDSLLSAQFGNRGIDQNYEYGIYNCDSDRMVFGNEVSATATAKPRVSLPKLANDEYYFGVYFPNKTVGLLSDLTVWKYLTGASVLVMGFFVYGLVIVLKQRRLSEIREDFIDNVTHELKTPLATLRLTSDALLQTTEVEKTKRYADIIKQETSRLENHIEQILLSSLIDRVDSTDLERGSLLQLLDELHETMQHLYPEIKWESDVTTEDKFVPTNATRIILFNLLDNAAKYGKGKVRLTVFDEGKKLIIQVADNGEGIPKTYQSRIFDKFFRVPSANIHNVKGYGLGMYLVKQYLRQLKGSIKLDSGPEGSTFTVLIPVQ